MRDRRMTHSFHGNVLPHEISTGLLPLPEALYTPEDHWLFMDSNWSPDFPLSARLERWFYGEDTGLWANTVIDFVDTAIPELLVATGPVYLPEYRVWVTAGDAQALAQRFVNGQYHGPLRSGLADSIRKQFFQAVFGALVRRMESMPLGDLPRLGNAISNAVRHRDILLYDRRPPVEALIRRFGAGGVLVPPRGDALFVVDDNRSYNKVNPYVVETATYFATVRRSLWIDSRLTIRYHIDTSPHDLEGFGPYYGQWGTKHDYQDFLRVYVPRGSQLVSASGLDSWAPRQAYGMTQFAGRLLVRENHAAAVTFHYTIPPNALLQIGTNRYRLSIRRQPGADLASIAVTVRGGPGVTLGASRLLARSVHLKHDAVIDVGLSDVDVAHTVDLPPPVYSDPYVSYAILRDRGHTL
jgi:hypothetical protein